MVIYAPACIYEGTSKSVEKIPVRKTAVGMGCCWPCGIVGGTITCSTPTCIPLPVQAWEEQVKMAQILAWETQMKFLRFVCPGYCDQLGYTSSLQLFQIFEKNSGFKNLFHQNKLIFYCHFPQTSRITFEFLSLIFTSLGYDQFQQFSFKLYIHTHIYSVSCIKRLSFRDHSDSRRGKLQDKLLSVFEG